MQSNKINEGVQNNDLRKIISNEISIDQYKSKIGNDENIVVVAVKVNGQEPAQDLSQFLETGLKKQAYDVDISSGPDTEGHYTVFVEIDRNSKTWDTVEKISQEICQLDNELSDIVFTSYENKNPQSLNKENFVNSVITSSYDYVVKHNKDAQKIADRMKFLNKY